MIEKIIFAVTGFLFIIGIICSNIAIGETTFHEMTKSQLTVLNEKIHEFRKVYGLFPKTLLELEELPYFARRRGSYLLRLDAWQHDLIYIFPAKYGNQEFDLYSVGVNGIDDHGDKDDITNWKEFNNWYYKRTQMIAEIVIITIFILVFLIIMIVKINQK